MQEAVLRIGTAFSELARLYPWLDAEATVRGLPPAMLNGMQVALEEAAANVAMHSGADAIIVRLRSSPGAAELVIEDAGRPFDPVAAPLDAKAAVLADAKIGGRGLRLLRHYCREMSYARLDGTNRLTLRFPMPGA